MHDNDKDTILLICGDAAEAARIMADLYEAQVGVIGPFQTAGMALAASAQTHATLAVLAGEPTGQRKTPQLAKTLLETWGVRSMLLDEAEHAVFDQADWRAPDSQVLRIRRALKREPLSL
ncbi:MAG: hypothetical protein KAG62_13045 [Caulobacter sp.]|jgi:hypothetical protein|uniref:hypothetical protein n=1 Tax=Caulobacter sp. CCH9-E1 TaxID=1768768 RepID=UPI00082CF5A4|nr:hypothetical protein [Caulobacter sp. CCH9-E1]MCK5910866.1 hypothetical protein [Caulobacter sp.]